MKTATLLGTLSMFAALSLCAHPAAATDVDGPDDCLKPHEDWGDAPECIPAYPTGVIGRFPTCAAFCPPGTQTFVCPPISTPPGPTGFIRHVQSTGGFWLGCYGGPPAGVLGIDSETNGKTNTPAVGTTACAPGLPTDCVQAAFGMTFDQDECYADGSDAGVLADPGFVPCTFGAVLYKAYQCLQTQHQVFLNICVDWNADGDWNDNFACPGGGCAYEWAVKNVPIVLAPGCNVLASPPFLAGPFIGPAWMRISLTSDIVPDDYPWNGSAGTAAQQFLGGETEDYPVFIGQVTGSLGSSWGTLKMLYR